MSTSVRSGEPTATALQSCLPAVGDVLVIVGSPRDAASYVGQRLAARAQGSVTGCALPPGFFGGAHIAHEPTVMALLSAPATDVDHQHDMAPGGDGDAFVRMARTTGARDARWTAIQADVTNGLRQLATWHDLIVVQKRTVDAPDALDGFDDLLLGTGIPTLVLPPVCAPSGAFDRVTIGWDGSGAATRAIRCALPLLAAAHDVLLLDGAPHRPHGTLPAFEPLPFLLRHGIEVTRRRIDATPSGAGAALLEKSRRFKADLVVMGAYGHSRLRERVLGGATRHVLEHAPVALFLHH